MKLSISLTLLACISAQSQDALRRQSRFCQNSMNSLIKMIPGVIKSNFCAKKLDIEGLGLKDGLKRNFICIRAKCCKIGTCPKPVEEEEEKPKPEEEKPTPLGPIVATKFCLKAKKKYQEIFDKQGIESAKFCHVDLDLVKFSSHKKHAEFCRIMGICCKIPKDECMPPKEEEEEGTNKPDLDKGSCKRTIKGWFKFFSDKNMKVGPFCEIDLDPLVNKLGKTKTMLLCKNMAFCCDNVTADQCKPPADEDPDVIKPDMDKKCRKMMSEFIRKVPAIKNYKDFCNFDKFLADKQQQMKMCFVKTKCCGVEKEDCMPKAEEKPQPKP